ncbi:hypothetical protein ACYATP_06600 [Lactobacillaceae bacterium Melli_B4]
MQKFTITGTNHWTTLAAIIENNLISWALVNDRPAVYVALPPINLANVGQLIQMAQSMREDVLFLNANNDASPGGINDQVQALTTWIELLNRYRSW